MYMNNFNNLGITSGKPGDSQSQVKELGETKFLLVCACLIENAHVFFLDFPCYAELTNRQYHR